MIVDCDVLQADGGTRTAAITGAYVALAIALNTLVKFKVVSRSPLVDSIAATSVGLVAARAMLDLSYEEDSRAGVDMNIVMTGSNKFVEVQATAEHAAFRRCPDGGTDCARALRNCAAPRDPGKRARASACEAAVRLLEQSRQAGRIRAGGGRRS